MKTFFSLFALTLLCACDDPDPSWCASHAELETTCAAGEGCVGAIVVDYARLEPRGYRTFSLGGQPVSRQEVEALAVEHVTRVHNAPPPDATDALPRGDFFVCFLLYNSGDSWLVIVHGPTGMVLFAGLEIWAQYEGRGQDPPLPPGFSSAAALGCSDGAAPPAERYLVKTGEPLSAAPTSTPEQAWEVAARLNLTEQIAAGQPYQALVVSYAAVNGEFDTEAADWLVWVTPLLSK